MPKRIGSEPRVRIYPLVEESFREFLNELREFKKTSISQLIEQAVIEKYGKEYAEFVEMLRKEETTADEVRNIQKETEFNGKKGL